MGLSLQGFPEVTDLSLSRSELPDCLRGWQGLFVLALCPQTREKGYLMLLLQSSGWTRAQPGLAG